MTQALLISLWLGDAALRAAGAGNTPSHAANHSVLIEQTRDDLDDLRTDTAFGVTSPLLAQSLADVAKKAEEERAKAKREQAKSADTKNADDAKKTAKAPTKVYTNKNLVDVPSPPAAASAEPTKSEPAGKNTSNKAATEKSDESAKDEAWWRTRMAGLRANLVQATNARVSKAALVKRLEAVRDNVPERGFSVAQAYAAASSELAKARAELDFCVGAENAAKAAISAAEEDARRAGVLPAWLR